MFQFIHCCFHTLPHTSTHIFSLLFLTPLLLSLTPIYSLNLAIFSLTVGSSSDFINDGGLQIDEDSTRHGLTGTSLGEERVQGVITTDGICPSTNANKIVNMQIFDGEYKGIMNIFLRAVS